MNSSITPASSLQRVERALYASGLVVVGWRNLAELPETWWVGDAPPDGGSLLVIGNVGGRFWRSVRSTDQFQGDHPLDAASVHATETVIAEALACTRELLYPDPQATRVNLLAVLNAMQWQHPSPLGLGIHAQYGLWQAVRAAWWVSDAAPTRVVQSPAPDVCASCTSQACVVACPATAVRVGEWPKLTACADYRFAPQSRCAETCVAREACPVAVEYRYDSDQLAHHYRLDRSLIRAYRSDPDA
ncbi:MAG: hypothetical protein AAF499_20025 [Pseudomonadota bacterium]